MHKRIFSFLNLLLIFNLALAEPIQKISNELGSDSDVIGVCIQLEAETSQLAEDERAEILEALNLGEGALPRFIQRAYHILGLRTFLTTGEKESRAWTFRTGSTAPEAAGRIHTDFQKGFIRAETIQSVSYTHLTLPTSDLV